MKLIEAMDVYDSRHVLRLVRLAERADGDRKILNVIAKRASTSRYFVILGDGRVAAGSEPRPYFYVYGLSEARVEEVIDDIYMISTRPDDVATGEGIKVDRVDCFSCKSDRCIKAVYVFHGRRWVPVKARVVYKVSVPRPEVVRVAREPVLEAMEKGLHVYASGFNIRYPARVSWDLGLCYVGMKPLYIEEFIPEEVPRPRLPILVFDIEVVNGEWLIVSFYKLKLLEDIARDDVWTVRCKLGEPCDELNESFKGARIVYGHNIVGFDIPILLRNYIIPDLILASKLDGVKILSSHGQSFQIGASKSLYAVAKRLKDAAGITQEELEIKARSDKILSSGDLNEIERYNRNDVVLTAKIANVILPFVYLVSGLTGIPPSVVQDLTAGLIAEYFMFRYYEYRGVLIGYKWSKARMEGDKVLLPGALSSQQSLLELLKTLQRR